MDELTNWTTLFLESLRAFGEQFMRALPAIIGAVLILLIGWLIAKLVSMAVTRLLRLVKFDALGDRIGLMEMLEKANIKMTPSKLLGRFAYWLLLLLVIITAADTLGWHALSKEISHLLELLPNLFVAAVFLIVGMYIAGFVRDIIASATASLSIGSGRVISQAIYYLLIVIVTLTALDQAGVDISIITNNLMLILGAVLLAAALSYGLASRDVLSNILASYFARSIYKPGQFVEIEGTRGEVKSVTGVAMIVKVEDDLLVIPTKDLMNHRIKILGA